MCLYINETQRIEGSIPGIQKTAGPSSSGFHSSLTRFVFFSTTHFPPNFPAYALADLSVSYEANSSYKETTVFGS